MASRTVDSEVETARKALDVAHEISTLLNTDLDKETLSICMSMLENGVNPEALYSVVSELRRESQLLKEAEDAE